jgi:hypothetical protein
MSEEGAVNVPKVHSASDKNEINRSLERIERSNERIGTKLDEMWTNMETQHEEVCRLLDGFPTDKE